MDSDTARRAVLAAGRPAGSPSDGSRGGEDRPASVETSVRGVVGALIDLGLTREIADARGRLQHMDPDREPEAYQAAFAELIASENRRRALRADG